MGEFVVRNLEFGIVTRLRREGETPAGWESEEMCTLQFSSVGSTVL